MQANFPDNGDRAGVAVFMAPQYHYDIALLQRDGRNRVVLTKRVADMETETAGPVIADHAVLLRITSEAEKYSFSYSTDGTEWTLLGTGEQRLIASEVANVWSGAYLGMFSIGRGTEADFDWFEYKALP